jgi:hypothetical protein
LSQERGDGSLEAAEESAGKLYEDEKSVKETAIESR